MSHRRTLLIACAALGAALVHSAPGQAQQATPPAAAERRGAGPDHRGPPSIDERLARMTTDLGLTADQAAKVRTVLTSAQRGMDSVLARRTNAHDAERAAMLATQTTTQKALTGILTSDQKLRHDAMRARVVGPRGMREHGQYSGPRGMRNHDRDGGPRGGPDGMRGDRPDRHGPPNGDRRGPQRRTHQPLTSGCRPIEWSGGYTNRDRNRR